MQFLSVWLTTNLSFQCFPPGRSWHLRRRRRPLVRRPVDVLLRWTLHSFETRLFQCPNWLAEETEVWTEVNYRSDYRLRPPSWCNSRRMNYPFHFHFAHFSHYDLPNLNHRLTSGFSSSRFRLSSTTQYRTDSLQSDANDGQWGA